MTRKLAWLSGTGGQVVDALARGVLSTCESARVLTLFWCANVIPGTLLVYRVLFNLSMLINIRRHFKFCCIEHFKHLYQDLSVVKSIFLSFFLQSERST